MARELACDTCIRLAALVAGSLFGALHNLFDSQIGPGFYNHFKHVPPTAAVWPWAVYIGATRGAALGLLLGAGCCIASESRSAARLPVAAVVRQMIVPLVAAAAGSALGGLAGRRFHAFLLRAGPARQEVDPSTWIVYGMHQGVYAGAVFGGLVL